MEEDAGADRAVARWALRARDSCKELRMSDFFGAGAVQFHARQPEFAAKRNEIVQQAKGLLKHLQEFADVAGSSTSDTVDAIKEYVFSTTEHIDIGLDRHDEQLKHGSRISGAQGKKRAKDNTVEEAHDSAKRAKTRPQDVFEPLVDNSNTPFSPDFRHLEGVATDLGPESQPEPAHHSSAAEAGTGSALRAKLARYAAQLDTDSSSSAKATYKHPFTTALEQLPGQYPQWILQTPTSCVPEPIKDQSFTFVDDAAALADMAAHLSTVREFAVDLEHSQRSFQGFTCLMQISTRSRDYIIDALALRSHMGAALARPFADASILKVLHGANSDVMWLQKDFGLFLVNMMDTGQAAAILGLPRGLAGLLQHFCQVTADKKHQRSDWCQRPLTSAMLRYAQTDTHFLLYIADQLRQKLLEVGERVADPSATPLPQPGPQGALGTSLERSRQLCMHLYEKPLFSPTTTYIQVYDTLGVQLNQPQQAALAALVAWRDVMCRQLDEGIGNMMPKWLLQALSQKLPQTPAEVGRIVKKNVVSKDYHKEIADVILGSQNHPIETPLDVQMASPNGVKVSAQHKDTAQPLLATDQYLHSIHRTPSASMDASEECVEAHTGALDTPSSLNSKKTKCTATLFMPKGTAVEAQGAGGGSVAPLFSFAGLPVKSVSFGGKAGVSGAADQVVTNPDSGAVAQQTPAATGVAVSQGTTSRLQWSMASMFGAPATMASTSVVPQGTAVGSQGASVPAAVVKKPAVKSMAGMFGAPAPKAPKTVHKLELPVAVQLASGQGSAAVASASLPDSTAAQTEVGDDTFGAKDAEQRKNAVRSAMAALREDSSEQAGMHEQDGGGSDQEKGLNGEAYGGHRGDELMSLRERFNAQKRRRRDADDEQPEDGQIEGSPQGKRASLSGQRRDSGAVLGDLTSITFSKKSRRTGGDDDGGLRQHSKAGGSTYQGKGRRREQAEFEEPFDYEAVLDGSDRLAPRERRSSGGRDGGRGRGGQRGGRRGGRSSGGRDGGRGGGARAPAPRKSWNPFQITEADVGAAKRAGNSRNGNKSAAFGNSSRR